jgi:hypothetical protein
MVRRVLWYSPSARRGIKSIYEGLNDHSEVELTKVELTP